MPAGDKVGWGADPKTGKRKPGVLPASHSHLQSRLDAFLSTHKVKAGPDSGMLVDAENEVRPKMEFDVQAKARKAVRFLTGSPQPGLAEAKGTAFPLFGGSRSFVSNTEDNLRIGWQLDFVGKFVPALSRSSTTRAMICTCSSRSRTTLRRVDALADAASARMVRTRAEPVPQLRPSPRSSGATSRETLRGRPGVSRTASSSGLTDQPKREADTLPTVHDRRRRVCGTSPPSSNDATQPKAELREAEISAGGRLTTRPARRGAVAFTRSSPPTKKGNVWMARDFWTFQDSRIYPRHGSSMRMQRHETGLPVGQGQRYECSPRAVPPQRSIDRRRQGRGHALCSATASATPCSARAACPSPARASTPTTSSRQRRTRASHGVVSPLLDFARALRGRTVMRDRTMKKEAYRGHGPDEQPGSGRHCSERPSSDAVVDEKRDESPGRAKGAFFRLRKTTDDGRSSWPKLARLQNRYPAVERPARRRSTARPSSTLTPSRSIAASASSSRPEPASSRPLSRARPATTPIHPEQGDPRHAHEP